MANVQPPFCLRLPKRHDGFMLLGLLIVLALGGISLMAAVDVWTLERQREREQQLLYVGDQYRQAIRRYFFAAPPGSPRILPKKFELLLEDDRYPIPVRHLRSLYPDPITGKAEWGEVRVGEHIAGVYSLSDAQPVKQAGFSPTYETFNGKTSYQEWVFAFNGPTAANVTAPASAPAITKPPAFGLPK
jgi:type II secretory pathway pseudopilin PulG